MMKNLLAAATIVGILTLTPTALAAGSQAQGYRFITDTLSGNRHPAQAQGYRVITDTLGGNRHARQGAAQGITIITDTLGGNGHPEEHAGAGLPLHHRHARPRRRHLGRPRRLGHRLQLGRRRRRSRNRSAAPPDRRHPARPPPPQPTRDLADSRRIREQGRRRTLTPAPPPHTANRLELIG